MKEALIDEAYLDAAIPRRAPKTHKDHYGRVLAVCGAVGYTGAPYFAVQAAVRTGTGVVTLCTPEPVYPILAGKLNEPVIYPVACNSAGQLNPIGAEQALARMGAPSAMLVGCGLGRSEETTAAVMLLLRHAECPVIVDADGINALVGHIDVLRSMRAPVILTPHRGEFARLTGQSNAGEPEARQFAEKTGAIVLLKSHRTAVFSPDGQLYRNTTGNPGMSKAGSGDVLAGILLSLCGQGLPPLSAACAGAYLHGAAGDRCANEIGEYGMTPTDLLDAIPKVLRRYNSREW
ncbi:MAG: NAD(P)H-hydrate dehydratase [Intestinibacillus sp.]